jgi:5'-deoxynucleotidase YfbR-like HD superfamily hydrolase
MIHRETIAEHSWQVMRVLLAIWPLCPRELLVHTMTHDIGESGSGDPPYPAKARNPVMKRECDRIEAETHLGMVLPWGLPPEQQLHERRRLAFKLAEFIEMWEKALQEQQMGNHLASLPASRCEIEIQSHIARLLEEGETEIVEAAESYITRRRAVWTT